ncbi:hypothetical protein [Oceanidesulfovibrio marinus]|uniref:Uncharacterized protein n=1 Tax=Oceanidesulfovibrio marinus TaxID=370038 RepID=A0ABX6NCZ8_9BACT|nr:hypothetical protein [Oceanidesulfovibrio marinus]QJT08476.1 hypothetical protein E8L03_05840 [Oceanidesulfovibrio marinus]
MPEIPANLLQYALYLRTILLSLMGLVLLAALGGPFIALVSEIAGRAQKKVFHDKFGKQMATMSVVFSLCALPFCLGGWAVLAFRHPAYVLEGVLSPLLGQASIFVLGVLAVALLLMLQYQTTWARLKDIKVFHITLGVLAVIVSIAGVYMLLALKRVMIQYPEAFAVDPSLQSFVSVARSIPLASTFWPFFAAVVLAAPAAAGGLGLLWLLMRRNKEDYGRDYYAYAFKRSAKFALAFGVLAACAVAWHAVWLAPRISELGLASIDLMKPEWMGLAVSILAMFTACILWGVIAASKTPLRQKPTAWLAAMLFFVSVLGEGLVLSRLYTLF